jgi:hypothetical protein
MPGGGRELGLQRICHPPELGVHFRRIRLVEMVRTSVATQGWLVFPTLVSRSRR